MTPLVRARQHDPIADIVRRREALIARLAVETKRGNVQRMDDPTLEQLRFLQILGEPTYREGVFLKARQLRFSQTNAAHTFQRFLAATSPVRTLIATNHTDTTKSLFRKFRTFVEHLPEPVRRWNPIAVNLTERSLESSHHALVNHLTAGGSSHGRSWTYQHAVCEEIAFWPDDEAVHASVTATLDEEATVTYISTPNGPKGLFARKVRAAREAQRRGDPGVVYHFARWCDYPEYRKTPPKGFEADDEERELIATYGLDLAQVYWRHQKIHGVKGIGPVRFRREYPLTEDDGFVVFDGSWFDIDYLQAVKDSLPEPVIGSCRIYAPPIPGMTYVSGLDPSWCNGGDDAVCCILDADGNQVAVLSMNEGGNDLFESLACELCHKYNHARALPETNPGGGGKELLEALEAYGVPLWTAEEDEGRDNRRYWTTHHGNKVKAFDHARRMVNNDAFKLNDHTTIEQLMDIREIPSGSDKGSKIEGHEGKDDHAMAFVLAAWNHRTIATPYADPRSTRRRYVSHRQPAAAVRRYQDRGLA